MRLRKAGIFLSLGFALLFAASTASASSLCDGISGNLVLNCGFELAYTGGAGTVPTDWTGAQFTSFESVVMAPINSGNQSMRIANDQNQPGEPLFSGAAILSQTFVDNPGDHYSFSFYVANSSPTGTGQLFQAFWGKSSSPTSGPPVFTDSGTLGAFTLETFSVVGTGSDTITFTSYNTPAYYFLDDVSLVDTSSGAAPEPATMALLATGLLVMGLRRRITL
jgi:hypothetical protein